jgi:uncharacterized protein YfaP (DUF2135 family)
MKPLFIIITFLIQTLFSANSQMLETPRGGWNYSGLVDQSDIISVSYPTPPIDRGAQKNRTMIQGKLKALKKSRKPLLVANGNPMLLNTDNEGNYKRHYAFGGGSNSVEVIAPDNTKRRVQFYEANPNQLRAKLRIICSWDAPEAEVDMHIITPDGQHAFWANPLLKDGGGLDVDSVDGPGPEMFTTITPMHGVYHLYINYWGNLDNSGYNFDPSKLEKPIITVQVTLLFNENTVNEKRESFIIPLRKIGDLNLIKSFIY